MSYKSVAEIRGEIQALKRLGSYKKKSRPLHLTISPEVYEKILDRLEVDQTVSRWVRGLILKELEK